MSSSSLPAAGGGGGEETALGVGCSSPTGKLFYQDDDHGGLTFSSCFESGNLGRVIPYPPSSSSSSHHHTRKHHQSSSSSRGGGGGGGEKHYRLWIASDCGGTDYTSDYSTWFYFSVRGGKKGSHGVFTIMNMNDHKGLFRHDMRVSSFGGSGGGYDGFRS